VTLADGSMERRETYSLIASPQNGRGRSVGALIETTRTASAISLNIDSGLTLGTNTTVTGSATISDGSSAGAACDSATAAAAIRHADDTDITLQGSGSDIYGSIVQDSRNAEELMQHVLNGHSIEDLTNLAHIKFGPMFTQPSFAGNPGQTATDVKYRWGCPSQLVAGCSAAQASYFPTVVIDANGAEVEIMNYHGQGILVIRNGDVHIRGSFNYMGIVLVEGKLRVTGTPRLEGAVIAMGDEAVINPGEESETSGTSLIRYNRCQVVNAQRGLTLNSLDFTEQTMDMPTFAWFEVVR
jgi:hypothetical protein